MAPHENRPLEAVGQGEWPSSVGLWVGFLVDTNHIWIDVRTRAQRALAD